jgi:hypothetical protein
VSSGQEHGLGARIDEGLEQCVTVEGGVINEDQFTSHKSEFTNQCPMPNAQCSMPNAQCPMLNAEVVNGLLADERIVLSLPPDRSGLQLE